MTQTEIAVKIILDRWEASIKSLDGLLDTLTDDDLQKQIAPGKNRGIYLLGHLIAVHDDMLVLLDMGKKLYPELSEPFIKMPDSTETSMPAVSELRSFWITQKNLMNEKFSQVKTEEWLEKHTAVSAEDFIQERHRNKLNIIVTRTSHLQYHIGQIRLLK